MEYYFPALSDGSNYSSSSSVITNTNTNTNNINVFDNRRNKERMNSKGPLGHEQKSKNKVKLSTDPQSVAARERRHRISERFKTLQSLVPGGTKMDTVSMLEEAIHYVKFLKNQIWLHQTMINFGVDDEPQYYDHDPSSDTVFQLPVHHGYPVGSATLDDVPRLQQALCYGQNSNDHFNIGSSTVQPPIPSMPEYPCFQGQEGMPNMDAYMKYYS